MSGRRPARAWTSLATIGALAACGRPPAARTTLAPAADASPAAAVDPPVAAAVAPAPAPGEVFAVIGEGAGPDDGTGYRLLVGVAAGPGDGQLVKLGVFGARCRFEVASALLIEIEDRREFHDHTPIDLPHLSSEPGKADWLNARRRCQPGTPCAEVSGGGLRMDALEPGRGATGSYRFETAAGPLVAAFEAGWCGPTTHH